MLKKIYSLAASLLIVSACTTDELVPVETPDNTSEITLSFNVDVPTAEVISKASNPLKEVDGVMQEIGVEDLYLYAYDASGAFIEKAKAKMITSTEGATSYQAIVSKDTRKIHFLSNCGASGLDASDVQTFNKMYTLPSNQYVFWGVKDFGSSDLEANLGQIDMYRNWAKLDVEFTTDGTAKDRLFEPSYMIYNKSMTNTLAAPVDKEINLPAGLDWIKPSSYDEPIPFGSSSFLFENDNIINKGLHSTFLIIRAKYNNPGANFTYYKIDLSNFEQEEGYVKVYNVIRNHHFKVSIKDVAISGVASFEEVIAEGKPADNNITASAELSDYPKITYNGETLIVTKTTWVFTEGGSLNMQADYTIGSTLSNDLLKYVAGAGIPTVTNGGVKLHDNGNITANINNPTSTEQRGYFYITGGKLQRMITLVLRQAYQFTNFSLTEAGSGANSAVIAHFKVPSDIEKAIFPLEFKFTSKKLYATESGVRIETDGKGNYTYVYTAQSYQAGGYNVTFKTNSPNAAGLVEKVALNAEYFATKTADLIVP